MNPPDPRASAAAIRYLPGDYAPKVIAKGRGAVAEAIIEHAKASGVFVHESPELVGLLMGVDLDSHIPPQLYMVIAELLAWLYQLEQETAGRGQDRADPVRADTSSLPDGQTTTWIRNH